MNSLQPVPHQEIQFVRKEEEAEAQPMAAKHCQYELWREINLILKLGDYSYDKAYKVLDQKPLHHVTGRFRYARRYMAPIGQNVFSPSRC